MDSASMAISFRMVGPHSPMNDGTASITSRTTLAVSMRAPVVSGADDGRKKALFRPVTPVPPPRAGALRVAQSAERPRSLHHMDRNEVGPYPQDRADGKIGSLPPALERAGRIVDLPIRSANGPEATLN